MMILDERLNEYILNYLILQLFKLRIIGSVLYNICIILMYIIVVFIWSVFRGLYVKDLDFSLIQFFLLWVRGLVQFRFDEIFKSWL